MFDGLFLPLAVAEGALTRWYQHMGHNSTLPDAHAKHMAAFGGGRATSFASRRRFWAMAASVNSSCAPRGPRNRRRPSLRMRLRCDHGRSFA
jgi:hypothetical protein